MDRYIPPIVWRVCARKLHAFETKRAARTHAVFVAKATGARVSVYRCPFCSRYHFGKKTRWRDRERD